MSKAFPYDLDFLTTNFREHPELYRIGRGEQGVLLVEPYKSEILPNWRFRTPHIAKESAQVIYGQFLEYKKSGEFVGMDMARKFLQMGFTRARRYANHSSGTKYAEDGSLLPQAEDWRTSPKAEAARIFYEVYLQVREDTEYKRLRKEFAKKYG